MTKVTCFYSDDRGRTSASRRRCLAAVFCVTAFSTVNLLLPAHVYADSSLRFFGGASSNDVDRVKIQIDDPANNAPGPPADIGAGDFTIELWIKAASPPGENDRSGTCDVGGWVDGNIIVDRDRFGQSRSFGLSLLDGMPAFQVEDENFAEVVCGTTDLRDGQWHHLAMQRRASDGRLWLYVDGVLQDERAGPDGDISYPDDGVCMGPCANSDHFLVLGAEKHDLAYGFSGWIDELRLSTVVRYPTAPFPAESFVPDPDTAALYHFDEGAGTDVGDSADGAQSGGELRVGVGGGSLAGPVWSGDTPLCAGGSPTRVQFNAARQDVGEAAGSAMVAVTRACDTANAVAVDFMSADDGAAEGQDYASVSGTLNWDAGDGTAKFVMVDIADDAIEESDESFTLTLSNPSGGANLGMPDTIILVIVDNESPGSDSDSGTDSDSSEVAGGDDDGTSATSFGLPTILLLLALAGRRCVVRAVSP